MFTYYVLAAHSEEILDVWIGERILQWILRSIKPAIRFSDRSRRRCSVSFCSFFFWCKKICLIYTFKPWENRPLIHTWKTHSPKRPLDPARNVPLEVGVSKASWEKPGHAMVHRFLVKRLVDGWVFIGKWCQNVIIELKRMKQISWAKRCNNGVFCGYDCTLYMFMLHHCELNWFQ